MWKIAIMILAAMIFVGCEEELAPEQKPSVDESAIWDEIASQYNFFRDKRAPNLCLGMWRYDYRTTIRVPCDQVQHLLKNP